MKRRITIIWIIVLLGLLNLKVDCRKDFNPPPPYKYTFIEKITVTPYQLNYNVGDTILLQLNIPGKKLLDSKTNTRIYFDSASFNIRPYLTLVFNNPFIGDGPFASFVFEPGVSVYTQNYSGITQAFITTGCSQTNDYILNMRVVLLLKGVFTLGVYNNDIKNCVNGYATNAQLELLMDVSDTHKAYYQQLPFTLIGKTADQSVLTQLDSKSLAVINVQ